ncbi:efflux RND transporter periplasmic adaptor subunit [Thalassotalea sp. PLHSN55]|uniref:efflux RND transporter periplasmic adaptor subunit n=1 Tax=Thalassotalea sp. PLHSN55 TaxID=3435888 RepID=UPI003F836C36
MNSAVKKNRRMVPLRYVLTPILILIVAIFILVVLKMLSPKPAKKAVEIKPPLVEVTHLTRENITFEVTSQGSVLPRTETNIISEVAGQITQVSPKFNVGGYFKKGELILAIDDITYQVALVQAQSRLGTVKAELLEEEARAKQAREEWLLSGKPLEHAPLLAVRIPQKQKAEAELLAAQADLKAAEIKLERTKIVAPYDAMIKSKHADIGQYVTTGTQLATTFAVDYAEVRLPIKQKDVEFLNLPGINEVSQALSQVNIYYQLSGKTHAWQSKLTRYEGVVDATSRVHYVIAQIDDPYAVANNAEHEALHVGTFVKAKISGKDLDDLIVIPRLAVHGANDLYFIDKNNQLKILPVNILRSDTKSVYTLDKFPANYRLITTKLEAPIEGMKLRVQGEEPIAKPEPAVSDEGAA